MLVESSAPFGKLHGAEPECDMLPNHVGDTSISHGLRFGCFEVELDTGRLLKRGMRVGLREQSFQVLALLLKHAGEVVTRDELRQCLWHDEVFVDFDKSLNTAVADLREALCDPADRPHFIETLPKRGYRFIANVFTRPAAAPERFVQRVRLVVLPFVNLTGDPAEEYFADAMTDEIITSLASVAPQQLAVIARTTAMHYKTSHKDVARIVRELGVDFIVEGGVRRANNNVSFNVQLIQGSDQTHLFAKKYDSEVLDIFSLQTQLAREVAAHIPAITESVTVAAVESRAKRKPTEDVLAYNAYMQGRYYIRQWIPECIAKAKQLFEHAIARDPQFALAYSSLAEVYGWMGWLGFVHPKDAFPAGVWAALRALEIDGTLAQAHAMLGLFRKEHDCNWVEVQRRTAQALSLDLSSPEIRFWRAGAYLLPLGKIEEAIAEIQRALEIDPLSVFLLKHLYGIATRAYVPPTSFAWVHFAVGEVDDAFEWMDRAIDAHDPMMTPIKTYAFMDPIRDDQRFHALLRKMNLDYPKAM